VTGIFALIGNAQPFRFFVGRHWRLRGKMVHHFCEALVKYLNSLENFCNLIIHFLAMDVWRLAILVFSSIFRLVILVLISLVRSIFMSAIICSQISFGMSVLGAVVTGVVTISVGFLLPC